MIWLRYSAPVAAVLMIVWMVGAGAQAPATFDRSTLSIETAEGRHAFDIELALTPAQQSRGLMFRRQLAADAGMLFFHQRDNVASMWMRNTFLPLDMLCAARCRRAV